MKHVPTLSLLALGAALIFQNPAYAADRRVIDSGGPVDWAAQDTYWQKTYPTRPYHTAAKTYETYQPAYRYGADIYAKNPGVTYDKLDQAQLRRDWNDARGTSKLSWEEANPATRDAYMRLYEAHHATGNTETKTQ